MLCVALLLWSTPPQPPSPQAQAAPCCVDSADGRAAVPVKAQESNAFLSAAAHRNKKLPRGPRGQSTCTTRSTHNI